MTTPLEVPKDLKAHSRALLKWAVERGGRFAATNRKPVEWATLWDMSVVNGLVRRGYVRRDGTIYAVTALGTQIAAQYEMPKNEKYWAEQRKWAEEDQAAEEADA